MAERGSQLVAEGAKSQDSRWIQVRRTVTQHSSWSMDGYAGELRT